MALTPDDEEIASQYRKMLRMGLPEGAVIQKMMIGGVSQSIQDAVLAGDDTISTANGGDDVGEQENKNGAAIEETKNNESGPPTKPSGTYDGTSPVTDDISQGEPSEEGEEVDRPSMRRLSSAMSFYEEVIVEDDELLEEEILHEDIEFEEEFLEEIVDDSEQIYDDDDSTGAAPTDTYMVDRQNAPDNQVGLKDQKPETGEDEYGSEQHLPSKGVGVADDQERQEQMGMYQNLSMVDQTPNEPTNVPTAIYGGSTAVVDVEDQRQLTGYQPQLDSRLKRTPEKPLPSPSSCWYWILCMILLGLIGASAGVGYWLTTRDGDEVTTLKPPNRTGPPTAAPSVSVSTEFDAVQGECDFDRLSNPNPIDQCICFGEIATIETDIRDRYLYNLEYFIPKYYENYDEDISSCSSRNQALVWISSGDDAQLTTAQRTQKFALATIFASLGGSQWNNNTNWLTYDDSCTWFGVACAQGYASELVLDENNLVGMLPSELSLLERLQFLMVARNKIDGPMPVSLFSIQALGTVDVGFNSMTGVIPPTVGDAVSLNSLNVENNSMSGRLTKSIGKASNLGYLNLKSNQFVSELPVELFDLQQMNELDIGENQFVGTISEDISKLTALTMLTLGPNLFTGTIPSSISSLSRLSSLSVRGIPGLSGRIPAEFGFQLNSLEDIIISDTSIGGNIDTSFGRLPNLKSLDFSNNQLRSAIPSELGNLTSLVSLDLGNNFLDGQIPDDIGNIATLQQIRLNNNLLEGGIPVSFGNLGSLNTMRLEANRLEDRVADGICDLRKDVLNVFVVDCPIEIEGASGTEIFGVVCEIPECCTECILQ